VGLPIDKCFIPQIERLEARQVPDGSILPTSPFPQRVAVELIGAVLNSNQETSPTWSSIAVQGKFLNPPWEGKPTPDLILPPVAIPSAPPPTGPEGLSNSSDLILKTTFPSLDTAEGIFNPEPPEKSVTRRSEKLSLELTKGLSKSPLPSRGLHDSWEARPQEKNGSPAKGWLSENALRVQGIQRISLNSNHTDSPPSGKPGESFSHLGGTFTKKTLPLQTMPGLFENQIQRESSTEPWGSSQNNSPSPEKGDLTQDYLVLSETMTRGLDPENIANFFTLFGGTPVGFMPAKREMNVPGEKHLGMGDEGEHFPPLFLGIFSLPVGDPLEPVAEGYQYLCNYSRNAIHAAERRVGLLSDHEDIIQQICVEWLEKAGPPETAFPKLLEKSPPEMQLLRETVSRVIARAIYHQRKSRVALGITECPAPAKTSERDWTEFKSDCEQGVGHLTQREWHILELRRQGKTFAEIGAEFGILRQRVWEIYHNVEGRLQKIFGKEGS
jgi:hypothetical protein